ncbi:hypothetical protein ERJ75_000647500 [Trypanosoma vivax]|nr:hypothetical protein ERJ75_000647500 [Trypanosoma vivax]
MLVLGFVIALAFAEQASATALAGLKQAGAQGLCSFAQTLKEASAISEAVATRLHTAARCAAAAEGRLRGAAYTLRARGGTRGEQDSEQGAWQETLEALGREADTAAQHAKAASEKAAAATSTALNFAAGGAALQDFILTLASIGTSSQDSGGKSCLDASVGIASCSNKPEKGQEKVMAATCPSLNNTLRLTTAPQEGQWTNTINKLKAPQWNSAELAEGTNKLGEDNDGSNKCPLITTAANAATKPGLLITTPGTAEVKESVVLGQFLKITYVGGSGADSESAFHDAFATSSSALDKEKKALEDSLAQLRSAEASHVKSASTKTECIVSQEAAAHIKKVNETLTAISEEEAKAREEAAQGQAATTNTQSSARHAQAQSGKNQKQRSDTASSKGMGKESDEMAANTLASDDASRRALAKHWSIMLMLMLSPMFLLVSPQ